MQVSLILDRSSSAGVFPAKGAPQESTGSGQEMPSLDKDGATFRAERLVQAHVRASDPGPRWVAPMLAQRRPTPQKFPLRHSACGA